MSMKEKRKKIAINLKRILKRTAFLAVFILPILILKIRAGVSFWESYTIVRFWVESTCHCKDYAKALRVFFLLLFKLSWRGFVPEYGLFSQKEYTTKSDVWQIGRWYPLVPGQTEQTTGKEDTPHMKFFSIGREAIAHILKIETFGKKVALLPVFTCFTVLDPFLQENWEIHFYRYNQDLSVDTGYFMTVFEKYQPAVCVFQPLSGMGFLESEKKLIEYAHQNNCLTVVDQTQDVYNDRNDACVDYYCGSLRKWYPFPDGSFLYSEKREIGQCQGLKENHIYQSAMGLCMFAGQLRQTYDNPYFRYLCKFMWTFSVSYLCSITIKTHTMSAFSRKVLSQQDEKRNVERRVENFRYIFEGIQGLQKVKPAFGSIDRLTSVPLSFPVYVEDRRSFNAYLNANGVRTQLLWSVPPYIQKHVKMDDATKYTYSHILSLPCDQRYDLEDMERMVDVIRAYDCLA